VVVAVGFIVLVAAAVEEEAREADFVVVEVEVAAVAMAGRVAS